MSIAVVFVCGTVIGIAIAAPARTVMAWMDAKLLGGDTPPR